MMEDRATLLVRCRERGAVFTPDPESGLDELQEQSGGTQLPLTDEARAFLEQYISPAVLAVFPEWQGLLIKSSVRGEAVWVVRNHQNGQKLAQETGQPVILLDEVLAEKGQTLGEAREASFPSGVAELTPRQEEAIAALLACASVQAAAKSVQIGRTTLYRWLKDETFLAGYQAARRQATAWVPGRLQHLAGKAVHTLERILDDPEALAPARVSAARTVLEFALPGREIPPVDNHRETVNPGLKPNELSLVQITTKEEHHDDDAQNLVERSAGDAAAQ